MPWVLITTKVCESRLSSVTSCTGFSGFCLFSWPLKSTSLITVKCCFKLNTCSPNKQTNTNNVNKTRALPQTIMMCPTRKKHQCLTPVFLLLLQEKHHTRMLEVRTYLTGWNKISAMPSLSIVTIRMYYLIGNIPLAAILIVYFSVNTTCT
jgi:hypothetical protein